MTSQIPTTGYVPSSPQVSYTKVEIPCQDMSFSSANGHLKMSLLWSSDLLTTPAKYSTRPLKIDQSINHRPGLLLVWNLMEAWESEWVIMFNRLSWPSRSTLAIYYNMTAMVLAWNEINFAKAAGLIDQSHRYGCHQAASREPAGSYDKTTRTAICFEHKTQYLLIRAPYTRIVVFWYISNIPPMISQSQISCNTPMLYIAAIFVKYCYITGSWLL